jgi:hypothetical protein
MHALYRYLASVVIAQLYPNLQTSLPQSLQVANLLKDFLSQADYKAVRMLEDQNGYSWRKFLPYLKVAYLPHYAKMSKSHSHYNASLLTLCTEMSIFSLQLVTCGDKERKMMVKQGLMEYIICLPSVLPQHSSAQQRARDLVSMLGKEMHLQPPSLNTMARARLAVTHFGLEKAMKTPVQELLSEIYSGH